MRSIALHGLITDGRLNKEACPGWVMRAFSDPLIDHGRPETIWMWMIRLLVTAGMLKGSHGFVALVLSDSAAAAHRKSGAFSTTRSIREMCLFAGVSDDVARAAIALLREHGLVDAPAANPTGGSVRRTLTVPFDDPRKVADGASMLEELYSRIDLPDLDLGEADAGVRAPGVESVLD